MKKYWDKFYQENKMIVWAAVVAIVLSLGILWKVKDEVTRFTLIMPIFAGFILFSILITSDEELEGEKGEAKPQALKVKRPVKK
ncbi:hypothetical protein FJY90_04025 [Candidatus Gottesmanbacteria bacterium]|nr:hypothetical protein [Candidatus Gottesmanbacteria bacterium]